MSGIIEPRPRLRPTAAQLDAHLQVLRAEVFEVETRTPHYAPMLDRLMRWSKALAPAERTLVLERAYIYGGTCLFAPLFAHTQLLAVDCRLASSEGNFGHVRHLAQSADIISWPPDAHATITELPVDSGSIDWLTIPNVVHHVRDQDGMFAEWSRVLRSGGRAFVFEGLVRELHQVPDDYVRYTPWGFEVQLEKAGLKLESWEPASGPFDVLAYVWQQALDFFPEPKRGEMRAWFYGGHYQQLQEWDRAYRENLRVATKQFPLAFLFEIVKP